MDRDAFDAIVGKIDGLIDEGESTQETAIGVSMYEAPQGISIKVSEDDTP